MRQPVGVNRFTHPHRLTHHCDSNPPTSPHPPTVGDSTNATATSSSRRRLTKRSTSILRARKLNQLSKLHRQLSGGFCTYGAGDTNITLILPNFDNQVRVYRLCRLPSTGTKERLP